MRAIDIYERNLRMSERMGADGEWVARTEAGLARLKSVLRDEADREVRDALSTTRDSAAPEGE